ncbi:TIGR00266 family protein [Sporolactobacillus sp. CPB3-1]|uniref:TIGR00266 family protein n=1 Tax=Sporolactobacillus mangiferae TaxID=2940498 RepID=A0ABT0M8G1_9BACL|nr:TIGR00266 family protein [Sporolactobacillus mangiferae]MCL1631154.1 TIGR00266 family protein [Sporolactobacillus mangiferae]
MNNHEIDYRIEGQEMQFVEIELDPGETVIAEAGSFMMMEDGIAMETIFGDGSSQSGGIMGKLFGAGKRLLTGESLFMTAFTNEGAGKRHVSFASPYPGRIIPLDLSLSSGEMICQKDAFLCAAKGVQVGIAFQKKLSTGFFGGEGFIMQKLEGDGLAFVHAGGMIKEIELEAGQTLKIDTGCLVAMSREVDYAIEFVRGVKTALFGGEGLFFATLRGPGKVIVQSLPFSRLASRVFSAMPGNPAGRSKDEGSLGGGLFDLFNGD